MISEYRDSTLPESCRAREGIISLSATRKVNGTLNYGVSLTLKIVARLLDLSNVHVT